MDRRTFLISAAALPLAPLAAHATSLDYTDGLVQQRLAAGDTVFLRYGASWCSTCAAQERVIGALKADNPAYGESITFVLADWDKHRSGQLAKTLKIPRRSTLVVLKGNQELGRLVAGTSKGQIKDLMDTALTAATA